MLQEESEELDVKKEIAAASPRHAIDISQVNMPLDMTVRSVALTLATRHCGDTTVKEGNLYQQLKMDNKLAGPLTVEHVIHCALIFERFLWGEFSKGMAGDAMANTLHEMEDAIAEKFKDEPPTRPHSGEPG
jgi:hypothetical protein